MESFLSPMLASAGKTFPNTRGWMMEPKYDGWRYVAYKDEHGKLNCYGGRNGADYTGQLPYLEAQLDALLPDGTAIDGELIGEDGWGDVQGTMTQSYPLVGTPLRYMVFDLTRLSLRDVRNYSYEKRTEALTVLEWDLFDHLDMVEAVVASEQGHLGLVQNGFEGSVWKQPVSTYSPKRSSQWLKFKYETTDEGTVTGFKAGQGEFKGMIGAIEFEMPGGVKSRASGMDLATRQDMTDNPTKWIGAVIEVKHNGIMASGSPRHPRFLRRRDDKMQPTQPAPVRRPRSPSAPTTKADIGTFRGASKRNYGAMAQGKLLDSIRSLENGAGEAHARCVNSGGDPQADLAKALAIRKAKGW